MKSAPQNGLQKMCPTVLGLYSNIWELKKKLSKPNKQLEFKEIASYPGSYAQVSVNLFTVIKISLFEKY